MNGITAHVLDTSLGRPAAGLTVRLAVLTPSGFQTLAEQDTNADGRVGNLLGDGPLHTGTYQLSFATGAYFQRLGHPTFFPEVEVRFNVADSAQHYHVPLLLSPFAYSTYRGS